MAKRGLALAIVLMAAALAASGAAPPPLPHWRACLAALQNGGGNCIIDAVGDSSFAGYYDQSGKKYFARNLTYFLARDLNTLNAAGIYANDNGWCGGGDDSRLAADRRFSAVAPAWGYLDAAKGIDASLGGGLIYAASAGNLVYSPGVAGLALNDYDSFLITYYSGPGGAAGTAAATGGRSVAIPQHDAGRFYQVVATAASANRTNTLTLSWTAGGSLPIACLDAYASTRPAIEIYNAGWVGATSSMIGPASDRAAAYDPWPALLARKSPLVILEGGIANDWLRGVPAATTLANFRAMVASLLANGQDVILVTCDPDNTNTQLQAEDVAIMNQVARQYHVPIFDWNARWVSYAVSNPLGYYYTDGLHPVPAGYADAAWGLFELVKPQ